MEDNSKYWVYIKNWHGHVRIFGTEAGEREIAIRLSSMEDAEKVKELFEKAGHDEVDAGKSFSLGTATTAERLRSKPNKDGFRYY